MFDMIGIGTAVYLVLGAVVSATRYAAIKDEADMLDVPRWYEYLRTVVFWVPDAVIRQFK